MKRVDYYLTVPQVERLKQLTETTGLTTSELIRRAVDEYLDKHLPPEPEPPAAKPKPAKK
jgi:arsenate reductase-like glutaredoxin family protein